MVYIYRVIFPFTLDQDIPSPCRYGIYVAVRDQLIQLRPIDYNPDLHFDFKQHLLKSLPHMVARGPNRNGLVDLKNPDQVAKWVGICLDNVEKEYRRPIAPGTQTAEDQIRPNPLGSNVGELFPTTQGQSPRNTRTRQTCWTLTFLGTLGMSRGRDI